MEADNRTAMENRHSRSPEISKFDWGLVEVAGQSRYKDAKLYPGGSRGWDWNETGTRHEPGIQPADVEELIERGAAVIVLSKGVHRRLQVCPETEQLLREHGIPYYILPSREAVEKYNELQATHPAGALIHSTC